MKLRSKFLAGLFAMVLVLSMTVGTALATTELPAAYEEAAGGAIADGQTDGHDVWIKITGGGVFHGDPDIAHATRSVDVTISGNATFDLGFVYNSSNGWAPLEQKGESVEGSKVYTFDMNGDGTDWCEAVVNLTNKSEGPLEVSKMDFKDESGAVLLSVGSAPAATEAVAEATTDAPVAAPKTGVISTALFLGLGAAVLGTGAVVLKKKED